MPSDSEVAGRDNSPARASIHSSRDVAPIEAASEPGEEDEFLAEAYDSSSVVTTSITSTVYAHTYEHGRRYHSFKNSRYPVPNDDIEQNREDMKHVMMLELTDGVLHYAPIGDDPQLILDIGTGTGTRRTFPKSLPASVSWERGCNLC